VLIRNLSKLAYESGCKGFLFGYEITNSSMEQEKGGKFRLVDRYVEYTKKIKKMGIFIKAHFIFGFDHDDIKSLLRLWFFCLRIRPFFTIVSLLTPLPGSKIYFEKLKNNSLRTQNWRNYSCHSLVFDHQKMNVPVANFTYPFIYGLFLFTTSTGGLLILFLIVVNAFLSI